MEELKTILEILILGSAAYAGFRYINDRRQRMTLDDDGVKFLNDLKNDLKAERDRVKGVIEHSDKLEDLEYAISKIEKCDISPGSRVHMKDFRAAYIVANNYRIGYFKDSNHELERKYIREL